MRELYLRNEIGIDFKLNSDVLISSIEGLGILKENIYFKHGSKSETFSSTSPISEINLGLVFMKGYPGYLAFVDYVKQSKSLYLHYKAVDEKYCYVEIVELTKGQLEFGVIRTNLRLDKLSSWLKKTELEIDVKQSSETKKYPYSYSHKYHASGNGLIRVLNNGHNRAEMIIKIIGEIKNPVMTISQFGKIIQTLRILTNDSGTFEISSISNNAYITKNGVSIYDLQDFTCTNFLTLALGESEIFFESGVTSFTQCYLTVFEEYEAN